MIGVAQVKRLGNAVVGGTIQLDSRLEDTTKRIEQAERRLTLYEQQLETKYANLESLLARLQSQGSSVANIGRR